MKVTKSIKKAIELLRLEHENREILEMHEEGGVWIDECSCLNELTNEELAKLLLEV